MPYLAQDNIEFVMILPLLPKFREMGMCLHTEG